MQAGSRELTEKKLVGKRTQMSFNNNSTVELWRGFMPGRNEISNRVGSALFSLEIYNSPLFFRDFNPAAAFEKWAAVEVTAFENIPDGMESFILPGGLHAVFIHHGPASEAAKTYEYIFKFWLPQSDFLLDHRPHFALMGEKYKNNAQDSEEEIWIPVRYK